MDWDKIRIFHAVAEAGSFTRAGDVLGLSQSAISRQISSLEEDLTTTLFHRHARGLLLTEQGEVLFRTAHDVVGKLAITEALISESHNRPEGELKVTAPVGLGSTWLTPRMKEFTELYPDMQVQLLLDDRALDLGMREADLALRLSPPTQADLVQRRLLTVHHHIFASPSYLQRNGVPQTPEDLDNHKVVSYGQRIGLPTPNPVNWIEYLGRPENNPRPAVLTVNNIYGVLQAVESGLGIGALPDYLVQQNSKVVPILPETEGPTYDVYFVYPEEMRNSKRIGVFRDFLLRKIAEWTF